ncbi:Protein of unknown function [Bacillus cereus]|nr:Protein of unknown function [Bacillus cereus]
MYILFGSGAKNITLVQ